MNSLIQHELGSILPRYLEDDKQVLVTITDVDTAPDLSQTIIWISIFNAENKDLILRKLEKNIYDIQGDLNEVLVLKKIPKIVFHKDESGDKIARLTSLLESERKKIS